MVPQRKVEEMDRRTLLKLGFAAGGAALVAGCVPATGTGSKDIVETAVAAGSFTTLVAAVQAAGLVETLQSPGPFTVFAPTDEAFAKLPAGTVESLLLPENKDTLVSILTYHVVAGNYPASSLVGKRGALTSVQGQGLHIDGRNGVTVENATVITPDVMASNGVIHVIDSVMLPK